MPLTAGDRLGPYEILGLVGSGGMGAVYRARDPRLARDVAVKVIATDGPPSAERLRRFEDEARAVASLSHPNVLTVFDVGARDGEPYVVFELLEGESLRQRLQGGPLPLRSAVETAVQLCRGLQAAHARGILHRDLKPENLFLTSDGFAKILDFGLAKLTRGDGADAGAERTQTVAGVVMGTPGYLSPEQARGLEADARSDIFALGAILYEALSGRRAFARATAADTISAILHEDPPPVQTASGPLPGPVERIVRRCLAKEPADRFHSAHDLALAFEAVLERPAGAPATPEEDAESRRPYPGLSPFTEADAGRFFGRGAEVEALWERIRSRKLLAVIGPSGAGKTSLVRAGVVASRPEGWAAIVCTPGVHPFRGLGQALVPELAGDVEALQRLLSVDDPAVALALVSRWRKGHGEALLVLDQFEELFALNSREVRERFADLVGRLTREGDVHVLLSLRDDFLMRCADHEPLARVFESLSPLPALSREGLGRALVEPAKTRGYRFEDEALVGEMVESVEGARGALPLLAFAVSRLWEKRDRERKLLTRAAYEEIGGVAGALAQHADATMDRIGADRQGIVREVFRNLVTAQGTRAVAEREELLSAFPQRLAAEEVLRELIDARLVTSYEAEGREGEPGHCRVEVVHESLLKAWPRLVRWQAQDEEGAVLRDQLKQAAHLWEEKGRTSDLLWRGTAYQEYVLWRDRYAGALTALEEDFARAMAERARRRRRFRRLVTVSIVAAALVVAGVTGALWRRSEAAREQAKAEALRAEAGKLLALARNHLEDDRTAALAYARGSLDLFDTAEARRFAVEVLWRGPVARILDVGRALEQARLPEAVGHLVTLVISPDRRWLAGADRAGDVVLLDLQGGPPRRIPAPLGTAGVLGFGPRSDLLVTPGPGHALTYWSLPGLRELRTAPLGAGVGSGGWVRYDKVVLFTQLSPGGGTVARVMDLPDGEPRVVASIPRGEGVWGVDAPATHVGVGRDGAVALRALDGTGRVTTLWRIPERPRSAEYAPRGDLVALTDRSGRTAVWSTADRAVRVVRILEGPDFVGSSFLALFDPQGRRFAQAGPGGTYSLWDLDAFPDTRPLVLGRPGLSTVRAAAFDPTGRWLATGDEARATVEFWPVASPRRRALPGLAASYYMAFTPDGRWLATCPSGKPPRLWPSSATDGQAQDLAGECAWLDTDPAGRILLYVRGEVRLHAVGGGKAGRFLDRADLALAGTGSPPLATLALDPAGRRVVASPFRFEGIAEPGSRVLAVWDLPARQRRLHSIAHLTDSRWQGYWQNSGMALAPDGRLYVGGPGGVRRLTLPGEPGGAVSSEAIHAAGSAFVDLSRDGHLLLVTASRSEGPLEPHDELLLFDVANGTSRRITTHGTRLFWGRLSSSGRVIVTGDHEGVVRVGPVTGAEPHLLLGHKGPINGLAVSPDERWIAASSDEATSIWPMPDVTKPPLHTLPHAELLAKLDALTNLRVVRDAASVTGWTLDIGPFPGWKDVPAW